MIAILIRFLNHLGVWLAEEERRQRGAAAPSWPGSAGMFLIYRSHGRFRAVKKLIAMCVALLFAMGTAGLAVAQEKKAEEKKPDEGQGHGEFAPSSTFVSRPAKR